MKPDMTDCEIKPTLTLHNLPPEVLWKCFSFLASLRDLVSLSKASHQLRTVALDHKLWDLLQRGQLIKPQYSFIRLENARSTAITTLGNRYLIRANAINITVDDLFTLEQLTFCMLTKTRYSSKISHITAIEPTKFAIGQIDGKISIFKIVVKKQPRYLIGHLRLQSNAFNIKRIRYMQTAHCDKHYCFGSKSLCTLPNGLLASAGYCTGEILIWDPNSGKCVKTFTGHKKSVSALAVLNDGKLVSGVGNIKNNNYSLQIWDTDHGLCVQELQAPRKKNSLGRVNALLTLTNGMLASARKNNIRVWDIKRMSFFKLTHREKTKDGKIAKVKRLADFPNGRLASWAPLAGTLRFWNINTGNSIIERTTIALGFDYDCGDITVLDETRLYVSVVNLDPVRSHGAALYSFPTPTFYHRPENRLAATKSVKI